MPVRRTSWPRTDSSKVIPAANDRFEETRFECRCRAVNAPPSRDPRDDVLPGKPEPQWPSAAAQRKRDQRCGRERGRLIGGLGPHNAAKDHVQQDWSHVFTDITFQTSIKECIHSIEIEYDG